jgi:hypothetical protein
MERFTRRLDVFLRRYVGPAGAGGFLSIAPYIMPTLAIGGETDVERVIQCAAPLVADAPPNHATACLYAVDAEIEVLGMWGALPTSGHVGAGSNHNFMPQRGALAGSAQSAFNPHDETSPAVPKAPLVTTDRVEFGVFAPLSAFGILAEFSVAADTTVFLPVAPFTLSRGEYACLQRIDAGQARLGFVWRRTETEPPS